MTPDERLLELGAVLDTQSPDDVAAHNAAVDEIRRIVASTGNSSPAEVERLLGHLDNPLLRGWVAWALLDQCTLIPDHKARCVAVIRELAGESGPQALAAQWWLRDNGHAS